MRTGIACWTTGWLACVAIALAASAANAQVDPMTAASGPVSARPYASFALPEPWPVPTAVAPTAAPTAPTPPAPTTSPSGPVEIDIQHGEPRKVIDGVGWVLGLPSKLLLLDPRASNHDVSDDTVEEAADYLVANEVDGVMIRVNQYDPLGEWRRLADNDRVGFGWRATVGTLYTLGYSVFPGRLVGNDWYNPYTDTVHVYSDVPALALEQAAQAKDVREKSHPGFYSATRLVPLMGIVHEARAKQAVFEHVDAHGTTDERAEARRILHPQLGTELGGQAAVFVPQGDALLSLGGAAVGHVVGRLQAKQIEAEANAVSPTSHEAEAPTAETPEPIEPIEGPLFGPPR